MDWKQLNSRKRVNNQAVALSPVHDATRSEFERDWDRVLFSTAFRRMHDKTQLFPLPENDVVHSRLTHSLEVASVGRSLGKAVGHTICERHRISREFDHHDVGWIVAVGCLAHDIGNPPFGHAGEDAIGRFFRSPLGASQITTLSDREKFDLCNFEGNAQGFRLLTRTQLEPDGGLHLTAASLAAFSKYPREAGEDLRVEGRAGTKKHGFFQSEKEIFQTVASETGLEEIKSAEGGLAWARHPLAYLVEAADDICYSILDIEDGVRLGYVQSKSAMEVLVRIAGKSPRFSDDRLKQFEDPRARVGYLRAMAVGQLVDEFKQAFLDAESAILENKFDGTLGDVIASAEHLKGLRDVARTTCYSAAPVVEIELAGYEALAGLLECFVPSFMCADESCTVRDKKVRSLLDTYSVVHDVGSPYGQALRITDFVSGMTDRYALTAYRRLKGIALPGYLR